jgi:hypothetical protein
MTDIYIDPSVATMPDAFVHLAHLVDAGHGVILVGPLPDAEPADLPGARRVDAVPGVVESGAWRVTADPAVCGDHRPGLRTLLVGPRPAPSPRPTPRCDAESRDLSTAILEILSRDVMG